MNFNKGFTLIELLVVVAIIGLLASVVLASINTARNRGGDAAVRSNLNSIRTIAEFLFDSEGCYMAVSPVPCSSGSTYPPAACSLTSNTLFEDAKVDAAINAAVSASGGSLANDSWCSQAVRGGSWAVAVSLRNRDGTGPNPDVWCVDSRGQARNFSLTGVQTIANSISANACI